MNTAGFAPGLAGGLKWIGRVRLFRSSVCALLVGHHDDVAENQRRARAEQLVRPLREAPDVPVLGVAYVGEGSRRGDLSEQVSQRRPDERREAGAADVLRLDGLDELSVDMPITIEPPRPISYLQTPSLMATCSVLGTRSQWTRDNSSLSRPCSSNLQIEHARIPRRMSCFYRFGLHIVLSVRPPMYIS